MGKTFRIRTQFDTDPDPGIANDEKSLTRQEFLAESDINNIIDQYQADGLAIMSGQTREAVYGDFTDPAFQDYHQAVNLVLKADQDFNSLPAKVRERFANNPAVLIQFLNDPANLEEARNLGLAKPAEEAVAPPAAGTVVKPA